jgi:hypothetical protein
VDKQSVPVRVLAAGLPIVVIALVFGAIGYVTTDSEPVPIPPLDVANQGIPATQGEITAVDANRITIVLDSGESRDYALTPGASVEVLEPITLAVIELGDWLNGGAIPHPDTLLALVSIILLPEPVTP